MATPQPIHLPLNDGYVCVSVLPDKFYDGIKGSTLIEQYSKRKRVRVPPSELLCSDYRITIPFGELPKHTRVNGFKYNTRDLLQFLEQIYNTKILCKRRNRALKHQMNVTFKLPLINQNQVHLRNQLYTLQPQF
jgi:hypothetical protein